MTTVLEMMVQGMMTSRIMSLQLTSKLWWKDSSHDSGGGDDGGMQQFDDRVTTASKFTSDVGKVRKEMTPAPNGATTE